MSENKKDVKIEYNRGTPRFNPTPGPTSLKKDETLTVQMIGFPAECKVEAIKFFHDSAKATPVGDWTRESGNGNGLSGKFSVTSSADTQAVVQDIEESDDDDCYWFSVVMEGPNAPKGGWSLDPEIINKKRD